MSDTDPQAPDNVEDAVDETAAETTSAEATTIVRPEGFPQAGDPQVARLLEAILFAAAEPLDEATIAARLPDGADVPALIAEVAEIYANRGVNLVEAGGKWFFRTAEDLAPMMRVYSQQARKLSRAAIETLAICAYHQPITRAEMEEIRGVGLSKGTIDMLFEQGWIMPRGRRQTPGKPVTWGTTEKFLVDFGLTSLEALPGVDELKAAGLLDKRPAIQITDAALPLENDEPMQGESGEGNPLAEDDRLMVDAAADFDNGAPAMARAEQNSGGDAEDEDEGGDDEDDEDEDFDDESDDEDSEDEDSDDEDSDDDDEDDSDDDESDDDEDDDDFDDDDGDEDDDDGDEDDDDDDKGKRRDA
ncbi:MAG TPA: SMC-Scp complex subunit ScpB [Alphaproteobacteria bacterium]|nr:SMC-Scp complex subunit ScpB [Alphaproteobacteria bacterium]